MAALWKRRMPMDCIQFAVVMRAGAHADTCEDRKSVLQPPYALASAHVYMWRLEERRQERKTSSLAAAATRFEALTKGGKVRTSRDKCFGFFLFSSSYPQWEAASSGKMAAAAAAAVNHRPHNATVFTQTHECGHFVIHVGQHELIKSATC
ncbi:hypothetical protein F2P81_017424 [Scophthalmus maximus]|uniref:Uncharacterized protein n=1 Tax=Scophthalmus maximus TaxID=52904 RepID=A0A6A4S8L0_SCOMX|nr:hypothetical protein F2P81_017424 [Scophthalmus maximus]